VSRAAVGSLARLRHVEADLAAELALDLSAVVSRVQLLQVGAAGGSKGGMEAACPCVM
jgi:hypothetical protein